MAKTKRKARKPVGRTKLLAAHHTGKLRPHRHTSYGSLAVILLVVFFPLLSVSRTAADDNSLQPTSYQTYAVVPGPTPKTAPVITNIQGGKVYTSNDPIPVSGTCSGNTLIKLFKNDVMGGATLCHNGAFSLSIDLFEGTNSLMARAYNANDEPGPDGAPITVKLLLPGTNLNGSDILSTLGPPAGQFYLTSEVYYRGAAAGDTMSWTFIIAGGQPPYAVSVGWGDGKTDLVSRGTAGQFQISHKYAKAIASGSYTIIVKSTDQAGNQAFLQLVAIVSGHAPASILSTVGGGQGGPFSLRLAWQLLAGAVIAVASFWIGEKREISIIRRQIKRTT